MKIVESYLLLANKCFTTEAENKYVIFLDAANQMYDLVNQYLSQNVDLNYKELLHKAEASIRNFSFDKVKIMKKNKFPKILDIIEEISIEEELHCIDQKPQGGFFIPTGHYSENRYMPMSYSIKEPNKFLLAPMCIIMGRLYRGEYNYHRVCKASLYRNKVQPKSRFWERLKTRQLSCLIHNYPITHVYKAGLVIDKIHINNIQIDVEAIAQHYGIKTSMIDMSCDKWVAAFFATAKLDTVQGVYFPIRTEKKKGAFYQYSTDFFYTIGKEIRPIGLQPLGRPEYQNGYVLRMSRRSDLNKDKNAKRTLFIHDYHHNRLIFAYVNRGNRLFPKELAIGKIDEIVETKNIHPDAYDYVVSKFYKTTPKSVINKYMIENEIKLDATIPHFSEEEIKNIISVWEEHDANRLLKRLLKPVIFYNSSSQSR